MKKTTFPRVSWQAGVPLTMAVLCILFCGGALAQAPTTIAYVTVQAARQGNFKGSEAALGQQGLIECLGFSYMTQEALDQASGLPAGKHSHSPIVILKHLDATTPQFLQASYTNETLKTVVIEFIKRSPDGKIVTSQTIKLTNAMVAKISQYGGLAAPEKKLANDGCYEEISLVFQKIEFQDIENKIGTTDNWSNR
jgi:type VI secretion system secreted protein Hcp